MEVLANVAMLPGESFVRAFPPPGIPNFGNTKVAFDVSLTVIAAILSFLFAKRLDGVREGTIIAALLVGFIAVCSEDIWPSLIDPVSGTERNLIGNRNRRGLSAPTALHTLQ